MTAISQKVLNAFVGLSQEIPVYQFSVGSTTLLTIGFWSEMGGNWSTKNLTTVASFGRRRVWLIIASQIGGISTWLVIW